MSGRNWIKFGLFIVAIIIGILALWYSSQLVNLLKEEERKKVELWADAMSEIQDVDIDGEISLIVYRILQENSTIPVILVSENGTMSHANLDTAKTKSPEYLKEQLKIMEEERSPMVVRISDEHQDKVYYRDSILLRQLTYYPYIQFTVILLFVLASFFAFRSSQKAEENKLWVGMSKETAHQLGTPISSLIAWVEMLKLQEGNNELVHEVEKDVKRLETITERFSRIGSSPELTVQNVSLILNNSILYLKSRTSSKVKYIINFDASKEILLPLNVALFEWVIENLCKNAIDAMRGAGIITLQLTEQPSNVIVDITDTGKGIPKRKFKTVFKAGYTTKKRGWGLGLSLAQRIINYYHKGKIYIKYSEIGKGTTFRIILKK